MFMQLTNSKPWLPVAIAITVACADITWGAEPRAIDFILSDALRAHNRLTAGQTRRTEYQALLAAKPILRETWNALTIGEFESDAEFANRKAQTKRVERANHAAGLARWQERLARFQEKKSVDDELPMFVAYPPSIPNSAVTLDIEATLDPATLPRFDRDVMSFNGVKVGLSGVEEYALQGEESVIGRCYLQSWDDVAIHVPDFALAKQFKTDYEAGRVKVRCRIEPRITKVESPIVDKAPEVRREFDRDALSRNIAKSLLVVAISGLLNKEPSGPIIGEPVYREVKVPGQIREGIRFHIDLVPLAMEVIDQNGTPAKGITLVPRRNVTLLEVVTTNEASEAVGLNRGDQIVEVGWRRVASMSELAEILSNDKRNELVVRCRRPTDGRKRTVSLDRQKLRSIHLREVSRAYTFPRISFAPFHQGGVTSVAISPDESCVAVCGAKKTSEGRSSYSVNVFDLVNGIQVLNDSEYTGSLIFSEDSQRLIGMGHGNVLTWNLTTGKKTSKDLGGLTVFMSSRGVPLVSVRGYAAQRMVGNEHLLVTTSPRNDIIEWFVDDWEMLSSCDCRTIHKGNTQAELSRPLAATYGGKIACLDEQARYSSQADILLYSDDREEAQRLAASYAMAFAFVKDGTQLLVAERTRIRRIDVTSGQEVSKIEVNEEYKAERAEISSDGRFVLRSGRGHVSVVRSSDGAQVWGGTLPLLYGRFGNVPEQQSMFPLAISRSGRIVAGGLTGGGFGVYSVPAAAK